MAPISRSNSGADSHGKKWSLSTPKARAQPSLNPTSNFSSNSPSWNFRIRQCRNLTICQYVSSVRAVDDRPAKDGFRLGNLGEFTEGLPLYYVLVFMRIAPRQVCIAGFTLSPDVRGEQRVPKAIRREVPMRVVRFIAADDAAQASCRVPRSILFLFPHEAPKPDIKNASGTIQQQTRGMSGLELAPGMRCPSHDRSRNRTGTHPAGRAL